MNESSILIIILSAVVVILAIALVLKSNRGENTSIVKIEQTGIVLDDSTIVPFEKVDEIVLADSFKNEIVFKKANEIQETTYREIAVSGAGKAMQHVGQGATPIFQQHYTRQQLQKLAGETGLFTSSVPVDELSRYKSGINEGLISSVKYEKGGVTKHQGFIELNAANFTGISPIAVAGIAMQGMAIISGQYYLKQIAKGLNNLQTSIDELKAIHEDEKIGILKSARERLQEISEMTYCSNVELNEIRSWAKEVRMVLGEYKSRYLNAYKKVQGYWFDGFFSDGAVKEYNKRITDMRYLLQVCMIADRILDEALLTEFVVRRKMDANDPALADIYKQMDKHYHEGFNANLAENYDKYFGNLDTKGQRISDAGVEGLFYSGEAMEEMLKPVRKNLSGMENDFERITLNSRRVIEGANANKEILMLIDDKTGEIKMFEPA